jgi:hypothetical protein
MCEHVQICDGNDGVPFNCARDQPWIANRPNPLIVCKDQRLKNNSLFFAEDSMGTVVGEQTLPTCRFNFCNSSVVVIEITSARCRGEPLRRAASCVPLRAGPLQSFRFRIRVPMIVTTFELSRSPIGARVPRRIRFGARPGPPTTPTALLRAPIHRHSPTLPQPRRKLHGGRPPAVRPLLLILPLLVLRLLLLLQLPLLPLPLRLLLLL